MSNHPNLFSNVKAPCAAPKEDMTKSTEIPGVLAEISEEEEDEDIEYEKVLDISHETEEESGRLEQQEKEMILKALKKNQNRRKNAAKDLGISERTLYRKIKLFGIEE